MLRVYDIDTPKTEFFVAINCIIFTVHMTKTLIKLEIQYPQGHGIILIRTSPIVITWKNKSVYF